MGTRANLLAGGGALWIAPTGTALPEVNNIDTGIITPTAPWVQTGFRIGPVEVGYEPSFEDVIVEEHLAAIKAILTAEKAMISTQFGERDKTAYDNAISALTASSVAAAADQAGQDLMSVGDGTLAEVSLLFIGTSPEGYSRAIHAHIAVPNAKIKDSYGKKFAGLPVEWMLLADPGKTAGKRLFQYYDITALPTS